MLTNIHVISIDYDDCGQYSTVREYIRTLMLEILSADPVAQIYIMVGSARQTNFGNCYSRRKNNNGNAFRVFDKFARLDNLLDPESTLNPRLQSYKNNIHMDDLLLEDIEQETAYGANFRLGLSKHEQDDSDNGDEQRTEFNSAVIPWYDKNKIVQTVLHITYILNKHLPKARHLTYHFFDDMAEIIRNVGAYVNAKYNEWPSNFTTKLYNASALQIQKTLEITGIATSVPKLIINKSVAKSIFLNLLKTKILELIAQNKAQELYELLNDRLKLSRWLLICSLLWDLGISPELFPNTLLKIALEQVAKKPVYLIALLQYKPDFFLKQPTISQKLLIELFLAELLEKRLNHVQILYFYIDDPLILLTNPKCHAHLPKLIPFLFELEQTKPHALQNTMSIKERLKRIIPAIPFLLIQDNVSLLLDLIRPYFALKPEFAVYILHLSTWYDQIKKNNIDSPAVILLKITRFLAAINIDCTAVKNNFSVFSQIIHEAPHSFNTAHAQRAWAVLLNTLTSEDPDLTVFLTLSMQIFALLLPPSVQEIPAAEQMQFNLSFRLFTEDAVPSINHTPTPIEIQILNALAKPLINRATSTVEIEESLTTIKLMLAREMPGTPEAAINLIERWALKHAAGSPKSYNKIWNEWLAASNNNGAQHLFSEDIVRILTDAVNNPEIPKTPRHCEASAGKQKQSVHCFYTLRIGSPRR